MALTCPNCRASLPGSPANGICPACKRPMAFAGKAPASLTVRSAEGPSREVVLSGVVKAGRHPDCGLSLNDREVSKEHVAFTPAADGWWLEDLRSSNGTFVNGRRVTRLRLKDGDEIALGATLLVFHGTSRTNPGTSNAAGVTMVQSVGQSVLASVRAESPSQAPQGFRPEREVKDVEALRRDYEKLRIANEFHRQVGLETDLSTLYDKILKVAFDLLHADNGVILLFNAETGELKPDAVRRKIAGEVMLSQTLLDQVVKSHQGVLTQDAIVDSRFSAAASIVAQGIRSAMAVPLVSKGALRGVLYLDTREIAGAFTEKDLRILTGVAAQAAVAIENAELARRIEHEAETRAHLSRFLSPALVEQAQKGQLELKKGGELCEVTVLFADIRGFTSMAEKSAPQEVVALLNEYFERMAEEVFANGGVLDKFIGDCIMALWGAPVRKADDAARALSAAVGMQSRLADYNRERQEQGKAPVAMGIGINTGQAVVGNMGSSKRLEYTAIGDAVNLAARLCDVAREGQIVASAYTLEKAGDAFDAKALPPAKVKGKQHVVPIFQVLGVNDTTHGK